MVFSKMQVRRILFVLVLSALFPAIGSAQYPQPASLSISPSSIERPAPYTLCAGNGENMTLDVQFEFTGGPGGTIYGWPSLEASGCIEVLAGESTPLGTYTYTAAKNTLNEDWVGVNASITINAPPRPPPDFRISIGPSSRTIDQGQLTTHTISFEPINGFYSYISLSVMNELPAGVSASFDPNPALPDGSSTLTITASSSAATGSFNFTVRGSGGGIERETSGSVTINPRQPASITFNPTYSYAGNQPCYTLTIGNGAPNMTVNLRYNLNFVPQPDTTIALDANGEWHYCPGHYDATGPYDFTAMKNNLRPDWVTLSPAVTHWVLPPNPTSLSIAPSSVMAGQETYRMTVGNGAGITLHTQYNFNGGPTITTYDWPSLSAVSPESPDGRADIMSASCAPPGPYNYTQIANTMNWIWLDVASTVTLNSPGPPVVTSVLPPGGTQGSNVPVVISGTSVCAGPPEPLSTTWPGLSFGGVTHGPGEIHATFNVSSTAPIGAATVTLTAGGGSTTFPFYITEPDFSISISPGSRTFNQGQSATTTVSISPVNGFSAEVWLSVTTELPSGVSESFDPNPALPGGSSTLTITASSSAATGSFNFTVRGSGGGIERETSGSVTINPRQPASMTVNPTSGYAGNETCYALTIGNGANMTVDLRYNLNFVPQPDTTITLDANGEWRYCPGHYDATGQYDFTAVKNDLLTDWVPLSPGAVSYFLWGPKPTSLAIAPSSVTIDQGSYRMTVGNGALVTLDTQFSISGGPTVTVFNWPSLGAVSPGSPDGQVDVWPGGCEAPGLYHYPQIANSLNGIWVPLPASVTVNAAGPPTVTSVTPTGGTRGTNVAVTITGTRMCGYAPSEALSTAWPGLTFSNVMPDASSLSATFNISSTASTGTATVTVTAGGGSTTFPFNITQTPVGLTKEYIYLGPRIIAAEVP